MLFVYKDISDKKDNLAELVQVNEKPDDGKEKAAGDTREDVTKILSSLPKLSNTEIQQSKERFNEIFEKWLETGVPKKGVEAGPTMIYKLIGEILNGNEAEGTKYEHGARLQEGITFFLFTLIDFIKLKTSQKEQIHPFILDVDDLLFTSAKNITSRISINDLSSIAASATRAPELKQWLGVSTIEELYSRIRYTQPDKLINLVGGQYSSLSTPELLDTIHMWQTVGAHSIAAEDPGSNSISSARELIRHIGELRDIPLVKYEVELSLNRLKKEEEAGPTTSYHPLDPGRARLIDKLDEQDAAESEALKNQLNLTSRFPFKKVLKTSKNYITVFDDGLLPEFVGKYNIDNPPNDSKATLQFDSYKSIPKNPSLNPFSSEDDKDMPILLQQLHRPAMRKLVEEDLGIDFKEIPLASQIHLLRFMQDQDSSMFNRLRDTLIKYPDAKANILKTFFACSQNTEYGVIILDLTEKYPDQAERIFDQFTQIIDVFQEEEAKLRQKMDENEDLRGKVDMAKLHKTITKRGTRMLTDFAMHADKIDNVEEYLKKAKAYNREVVALGGLFSASSKSGSEAVSPETINKLIDNIKIDTVQGGNLIKSDSREVMLDPANYTNPEKFSVEDYKMVVRNLKKAYSKIDPGWLDHLIDNIPEDLSSSDVSFLLIKNKKNELVGVIKQKKVAENRYYLGTMYVEEEFQKGFGIGLYLDAYKKQGLPEDAVIEGTVAAANSAACRHIDAVGYVGNRIVTEGSGKKESRPLINLNLNPQQNYKTKNKKEFSEAKIQEYYKQGSELADIKIFLKDTSSENVEQYTSELNEWLERGYGLTRFFYEDGKNSQKTYLVLEKSTSKVAQKPYLKLVA